MLINNLSDKALIEVAYILGPLKYLNSQEHITFFFRKVGYEIPDTDLVDSFGEISQVIDELISVVQQLLAADTDSKRTEVLGSLLPVVIQAFEVVNNLGNTIKAAPGLAEEFVKNAPLDDLPRRLLDYLIFLTLNKRYPKIFGILYLTGVLDEIDLPQKDDIFQAVCNLKLIHWDRIPRYFSEPEVIFDQIYQWNADFQTNLFFQRLELFLRAMALPGGIYKQNQIVRNTLGNSTADLLEMRIPVFSDGIYPGNFYQLGLNLTPVEAKAAKKKGIALIPYLLGATSIKTELNKDWDFVLTSSVGLDNGLGISIKPPFEIEVFTNIFSNPVSAGSMDAGVSIQQKRDKNNQIPEIFLFGSKTNTHLSVSGISIKFSINTAPLNPDVGFELTVQEIDLLITTKGSDGFLQKVLPKDGIRIDFDLTIGWSNKKGLYFRGGAGLETTLPINRNLFDVLLINSVYLALIAKESEISAAVAASVTLKMGPVVVAIEQMGLKAIFSFPERGGNLGPVNLGIGFKPPKGAGLVIDASAVVGAGFLEFDPDNAMYSGFVYLEIVKKISVTAVGLITTRMPDGSPGFSLLALIAVKFSPGIQLGYGFTLNGIGGILGINRTVTVEVLRTGLRNGRLGSILFPSDPKKNIARIISDLKAVFPPAAGRFVFGPMVILGWGPNELIKLELGIILELPDPVRLLILGRLSLKLPDEKNPVVRLKLDSLGVIEFATGEVSLDAVLYDSEIKGFTITGEMALRANFGASPGFLLSVGGFHPAFKAPPGFPALQRVAISLATGDNPRLRLAAYMAITTNTVQFGAALEIYAKAGPFSLEGQLSFDALIQFDPFGLAIGMGAMIAIKWDEAELLCLRLEMNLTGPTPWHAWGEVQFKILLVEVKIAFDVTTGESETLPPPMPVDLTKMMLKALQDPINWSTQLPLGEHPLVVFREQQKQTGILVHPLAMLQVSQQVAPLNKKLYKFGNAPLEEGEQYFSLTVTGAVVNDSDYVEDWFAPAQFIEMDDNEKLAADSFEKEKAGIRFTQDGYICGTPVTEDMGYETNPQARAGKVSATAKVKSRSTRKPEPYTMTSELLQQVASIGAVGQSLLQKTGTSKYQDAGAQTITAPVFSINPRSYAVIGGDTAAENAAGGTTTVIDPVTGLGTTTSAVTGISGIEELGVAASYTAARELLKKNQTASAASQVRLKIVPFIG